MSKPKNTKTSNAKTAKKNTVKKVSKATKSKSKSGGVHVAPYKVEFKRVLPKQKEKPKKTVKKKAVSTKRSKAALNSNKWFKSCSPAKRVWIIAAAAAAATATATSAVIAAMITKPKKQLKVGDTLFFPEYGLITVSERGMFDRKTSDGKPVSFSEYSICKDAGGEIIAFDKEEDTMPIVPARFYDCFNREENFEQDLNSYLLKKASLDLESAVGYFSEDDLEDLKLKIIYEKTCSALEAVNNAYGAKDETKEKKEESPDLVIDGIPLRKGDDIFLTKQTKKKNNGLFKVAKKRTPKKTKK